MADEGPGDVIRHFRELAKLTQEEMALAVGKTEPAAWQWENGKHHPRQTTVVKLDRLLKADGAILRALGYRDPAADDHDVISQLRAEMAELRHRLELVEGRHQARTGAAASPGGGKRRRRAAG